MAGHTHNSDLFEAAASWIVKLRSDAASQADRDAFELWLLEDERHRQNFDEALQLWQDTAVVGYRQWPELAADSKLVHPPQDQGRTTLAGLGQWLFGGGLIAGFATVFIFVLLPLLNQPHQPDIIYQTAIGEKQSYTLPDGSQVQLNTRSELAVSFSDKTRNVELRRGEAFFTVASNKNRPFIVDTGNTKIKVVGTAFNVYRQPEDTVITVTEGIVRVSESLPEQTAYLAETRQLTANQQLKHSKRRGLGKIKPAKLEVSTAWLNNNVVFDQVPLQQALTELSRYMEADIELDNPALGEMTVSGTFSLEQPRSSLAALAETFKLQQKNLTNNRIVLSHQSP